MNLTVLLLPLLIGLTWARLIRPWGNTIEGTRIHVAPLPVLARIRMHIIPALAALLLAVVLAVNGWIPWWAIAFPIVSDILLIAIPISYVLTDVGIRLGWRSFRRWTEFAGVRRARGGARLQGVAGARGLHIWLSGDRGDDEFLHFLRQTHRNAYKGTNKVVPFPADRVSAVVDDHGVPPQTSVSAYVADR